MSVLFIDIEKKWAGNMRKSFSSGDALRTILQAAPVYAENMVGKVFLYVFENQYIEVTYRAKEFKHLTGVSTKLSAGKVNIDCLPEAIKEKLLPALL